jgi:hypothetical protein
LAIDVKVEGRGIVEDVKRGVVRAAETVKATIPVVAGVIARSLEAIAPAEYRTGLYEEVLARELEKKILEHRERIKKELDKLIEEMDRDLMLQLSKRIAGTGTIAESVRKAYIPGEFVPYKVEFKLEPDRRKIRAIIAAALREQLRT